jgi:transposase
MPAPLSVDLRRRVLADFQKGLTFADLGRKYTVSAEWVRRFIRRHQTTGEVAARPPRIKKPPFHRRHEAALRAAVAADPGLTLERLRTTLGVPVSLGTLHAALRALKISFKKRPSSPPSRTGRTSPPSGPSSAPSRPPASTRTGSSSSTRRG